MRRFLRSFFRRGPVDQFSDHAGPWTISDIEFHLHKLAGQVSFQHNRRADVIRGPMLTQFQFEHEKMGFIGGVQNGVPFFIFISDLRAGASARHPLAALLNSDPEQGRVPFNQVSFEQLTVRLPEIVTALEGPERSDMLEQLKNTRRRKNLAE